MRRRAFRSWILAAVCILVATGCSEEKDLPNAINNPPRIESLTPTLAAVVGGGQVEVLCTAVDDDFDLLSYVWMADGGVFVGRTDRSTVRWEAPIDGAGTYEISVVVNDGTDDSVPGRINIDVLGESGSLTGVVTASSSGDPLEGVTVGIQDRSMVTSAEGAYSFEGLPIGNFQVTATLDGYQSFASPFEVKDGPNQFNFSLVAAAEVGRVFGFVRNSLGQAVQGATVRLGTASQTSGPDGGYEFTGVARDGFVLQATRDGYTFFSTSGVLESEELQVDIQLNADEPEPPTNVRATKDGLDIMLTWDPSSSDTVEEYQVYWRIDDGGTVELPNGRLPSTSTSVSITGEADRRYRFWISAYNFEGEQGDVSVPISNTVVLTALSDWVEIPGGPAVIGDATPGTSPDDAEPHPDNPIDIDAFRIEQTEVTNRQYLAFLFEARSTGDVEILDGDIYGNGELLVVSEASKVRFNPESNKFELVAASFAEHPMVGVTWFGANAYAEYYGRRLPTEVEWEKAARGVSTASGRFPGSDVGYGTRYPWGNDAADAVRANFGSQTGATLAVATLPEGATAHWDEPIYHMAGNAWEWCQDWLGLYTAPHAPPATGERKVLRGGSYHDEGRWLQNWVRFSSVPSVSSPWTGFRCAE